jgi:hypothetical protein
MKNRTQVKRQSSFADQTWHSKLRLAGATADKKEKGKINSACPYLFILMIFAAGCQKGQEATTAGVIKASASAEVETKGQLEQAQKENQQLKQQVETLTRQPGDKKAEAIYQVQSVRIGNYTNIYDEDKDGNKEKLVVYVSPIDETGDAIKAAGEVNVQLWNLSKASANALLAEWTMGANELKKTWLNSIFSSGYRMSFDVTEATKDLTAGKTGLTVKVTFMDYLSGKTFTEQKAIK